MKTIKEVRQSFWSFLDECRPDLAAQFKARQTQNKYSVDVRVSFVDYVDSLAKSEEISEALASRVTL